MLSRRDWIRSAAVLTTAAPLAAVAAGQEKKSPPKPPGDGKGPYKLNPLPYAYDALEPVIDAETMTIHHTKHQQAYVDALNNFVAANAEKMEAVPPPVETICRQVNKIQANARQGIRNNAGGVFNHEFFWSVMAKPGTPVTSGGPKGELLKAIEASFKGGFDTLKGGFVLAGTRRFGSGWAWLVPGAGKDKPLEIVDTPNQDNPLMDGGPRPILGIDVWEHAYYLKYRNLRKKYIEEWFKVVNWDAVAENFAKIDKSAPGVKDVSPPSKK